MTEQTNTETALADLSLADYRAQRETPAEAASAKEESDSKKPAAGADDALGEDEADAGTAAESEHDRKPAKRGGFQRKLEKQEREIEDLRKQLAEGMSTRSSADAKTQSSSAALKEETKTETPAAATPAAAELPKLAAKPKLEDFDSIEGFTEALTDWKLDAKDLAREQQAKQAKAKAESQKVIDEWNTRKAEAQNAHDDYDDVLETAKDIKLTPAHQAIFLESEVGPEIAYQLAQNHDELKKFAAMNPLQAAKFFGKLEAAYTEDAPEPETKTSNAPRPIRTVGGRATSTAAKPDPSKMSLADYRRARESGKLR